MQSRVYFIAEDKDRDNATQSCHYLVADLHDQHLEMYNFVIGCMAFKDQHYKNDCT
jgi:hypothetical protein